MRGDRWVVGVQCHPERLESTPEEIDGLWADFMQAAEAAAPDGHRRSRGEDAEHACSWICPSRSCGSTSPIVPSRPTSTTSGPDTLAAARSHPLDARFAPVDDRPFDPGCLRRHLRRLRRPAHQGLADAAARPACLAVRQGAASCRAWSSTSATAAGAGGRSTGCCRPARALPTLVMDLRGQGSSWRSGDTPDPDAAEETGQYPGFATRGIAAPDTYFYRRLMTDSVRAVEAARAHPAGGPGARGRDGRLAGRRPDAGRGRPGAGPDAGPARRAVHVPLAPRHPDHRLRPVSRDRAAGARSTATQAERAFTTLDYHDGVNFAARSRTPALFSVAPDGRHLPALHDLRRVQPLRRSQGHRGLPVQRPRGRRDAAHGTQDAPPGRSSRG